MKLLSPALPALLGLLVSAGCSSNSLYFGTETSSGLKVAGAQAAPTNVSLAYQRAEMALIPPKTDGSTHAVFGGLDHDYSWTDGFLIAQTFATGNAAVIAANGTLPSDQQMRPDPGSNQGRKLFFSTGTTFGFDLNLGQDLGSTVPSLVMGYRRAEATVIPIRDASQEVNSVYADISIAHDNNGKLAKNIAAAGKNRADADVGRLPASGNGVRIRQTFATGRAALAVAARSDAKAKLNQAAGLGTAYQNATDLVTLRDRALAKLDAVTDATKQEAIRSKVNEIAAPAGFAPARSWGETRNIVVNFNATQITQLQTAFPELQ